MYNLADKNAVRRREPCEGGRAYCYAVAARFILSTAAPGNKVAAAALCFSVRAPTRNNFYTPVSERSFLLKFSQPTAVVGQREKFCRAATTVEINLIFCCRVCEHFKAIFSPGRGTVRTVPEWILFPHYYVKRLMTLRGDKQACCR